MSRFSMFAKKIQFPIAGVTSVLKGFVSGYSLYALMEKFGASNALSFGVSIPAAVGNVYAQVSVLDPPKNKSNVSIQEEPGAQAPIVTTPLLNSS